MVTACRGSECLLLSTLRSSWPFQCSHRIQHFSLLVKPEFRAFFFCVSSHRCLQTYGYSLHKTGFPREVRSMLVHLRTPFQDPLEPGKVAVLQILWFYDSVTSLKYLFQKQSKPHSWSSIWNGLCIFEELFIHEELW